MQKILCVLICHLLEMPGNLLTIQVLSPWATSQFTVYLLLTFCLEKDWQLHTYTRLCDFSFVLAFQTEFKFLHPINFKNNSYTSLFTPIYTCNILHNLFTVRVKTGATVTLPCTKRWINASKRSTKYKFSSLFMVIQTKVFVVSYWQHQSETNNILTS